MKRAMARQAEGESLAAAALGEASDTMMAHPLALQLRNLPSLVEIGVDKDTTVVFPAPLTVMLILSGHAARTPDPGTAPVQATRHRGNGLAATASGNSPSQPV